jgi:hypothetical protein
MRGLLLVGATLALAATCSWGAGSPALSEARRHREEIAVQLAAETAAVTRLTRQLAALMREGEASLGELGRAEGDLAEREGRIVRLRGDLLSADRTLADDLRRQGDESLRTQARSGTPGEADRIVALFREADRRVPLETSFPPPDRHLAGAVKALVPDLGDLPGGKEAQGILDELRRRLTTLKGDADAELRVLGERQALLLRLGSSSGTGLEVARYARGLDQAKGLLDARRREYDEVLSGLPTTIKAR